MLYIHNNSTSVMQMIGEMTNSCVDFVTFFAVKKEIEERKKEKGQEEKKLFLQFVSLCASNTGRFTFHESIQVSDFRV